MTTRPRTQEPTVIDDTTAKSLSYDVRDELAQLLGKGSGHDFRCEVDVVLDDGTFAILVGTSNAGFRGIEGHFENLVGPKRFTRSLGHVTQYTVIDPAANDSSV